MFHKPLPSGRGMPDATLDPVPTRRPVDPAPVDLSASAIPALLWRSRGWIALGAALGLACAVLFLSAATPRYTADSQLLINPNDLHVVENSLTATSGPSDANLAEVESQVRVLTSEKVLSQVVQTLHLADDPRFNGSPSKLKALLNGMTDALGLGHPTSVDRSLQAFRTLSAMVGARREDRTYVVDLSVTTADPDMSVEIARAIVATYLDLQGQARSALAQRATGELSARLDTLKDRLRVAEDRVEAFKLQNGISGLPGGGLGERQLGEVSTQLVSARARADAAKARLDQIGVVLAGNADVGALTEAVQSQTISGLRLQYAEVLRKQAELKGELGARHPAVIDIKAQAAQMKSLIDAEVRRLAQAARGDYQRAQADQASLTRALASQESRNHTTDQALVKLRELEREAEAGRAVYQSFLNRSRETSQQEQMNTANVRVISDATLPEKSYPKTAVVLLLGLLLGAALGGGLAVALPNLSAAVRPRQRFAA